MLTKLYCYKVFLQYNFLLILQHYPITTMHIQDSVLIGYFGFFVYDLNVLFCRRQSNNFWYLQKIQFWNRTEINTDFQHSSGCKGWQTGRQPIVSLYIIYVWVVHRVVSIVKTIFRKTYILSYYFQSKILCKV